MIPIARHLKELIKNSTDIREKFSVFVAPNIHDDAKNRRDLPNSKTILIYVVMLLMILSKK